jgi:hypothetical protein
MVPPSNLPELRSTLGVFVQSARFIPIYAHIVAPLTALTRSYAGKPVPYIWDDKTQTAYDNVRNLLLDGIHLPPPRLLPTLPRLWRRIKQRKIFWPQPIQRLTPRHRLHRSYPLTLPLKPWYTSPRPTAPIPFPTTTPAVFTSPGGPKLV